MTHHAQCITKLVHVVFRCAWRARPPALLFIIDESCRVTEYNVLGNIRALASRYDLLYRKSMLLPSIIQRYADAGLHRAHAACLATATASELWQVAKCQTPLHGHRLRTLPTDGCTTILQLAVQQIHHTNGQKFATSQHLDMSRCWAVAL